MRLGELLTFIFAVGTAEKYAKEEARWMEMRNARRGLQRKNQQRLHICRR